MGPLDEDLDALWVADKSAAFLQRVNSLNTPHKVNKSGLSAVLIPHSAPGEPGLEIKATAPKTGEGRCSTGLGRGLCPPGLNFRQVGEICQA